MKFLLKMLLFTSFVFANEGGGQILIKKSEQKIYEPNESYFSGKPLVKMIFSAENFSVASVRFDKGVRTAWHTHPAGQRLIVTSGVIYTGTKYGVVQVANVGDAIFCPPDTPHWHGAGLDTHGEHIAITGIKDNKSVTWLEKLSDAEYENFIKGVK
ncbi:cupin domain-containing protein [Campylobacter mucosalis]|uniref:cupin domain-containing protein n=1 Tax=Campylobacter mucosalis TaxID=202 RepID=UPI00201607CC|nr:cupin domain-containing protein [Campylobacter mucosalis]